MIQWSEPRTPGQDGGPPYDHVFAETPLGRITIEWKSWKDTPTYFCELPWIDATRKPAATAYVQGHSLAEAKFRAEQALHDKKNELERYLR